MLSLIELGKHLWHEKFDFGISKIQTRTIYFYKGWNGGKCYITIIPRKFKTSRIPDDI